MNLSFNLYRLQSIDTQYRKITRRLAQIEQILLADETVRAANEQKMLAEEAERKIHSEIKEIQARSQEKKIKLELHQKSLFGGKVRNPKELQDLQAESEVLRRNIQKLEDEQLDVMLALETAQEAFKEADLAYHRALDKKASENSLMLGEKSKLEVEQQQLRSQRQALTSPLPKQTLDEYQALFKAKGGRAVAEIVDDCCEGCGVQLPPADIQAAKSSGSLAHCKTCGRILYKA